MYTELYLIKGMNCAACSRQVERKLSKVEGVDSAIVNLATEKLHIVYDQNLVNQALIIENIEKIGFTATLWNNDVAHEDELNKNKEKEHRQKIQLILAIIFSFPLFYIAMAPMDFVVKYLPLPFPEFINPNIFPMRYAFAQLFLVIPVMIIGKNFYTGGFRAIYHKGPNMDSLIAVGTSAAFIYSAYSLTQIVQDDMHFVHQLYFESVAIIITLILLGKYFEALARKRTGDAIRSLMDLSPKMALKVEASTDYKEEKLIPLDFVKIDDALRVKPGERIPADGIVLIGESYVDESMLTGESKPLMKTAGSAVIGGTLNKNGSFVMQAKKLGKDSTLAQIIRLVEDAQAERPAIARLADTVSGVFVQIVFVIATITALAWFFNGANPSFILQVFTAVLLIACPCALGLATPTALMVGIGKGAELGVLIKGAGALEVASTANTVVFDKTGTITEGNFKVHECIIYNNAYQLAQIKEIAAALESKSEHPLAQAIMHDYQESANKTLPDLVENLTDFEAKAGLGISATINDKKYRIGNRKYIEENIPFTDEMIEDASEKSLQGKSLIFLADENSCIALFTVADTIKHDTQSTIQALLNMGIEPIMLTGDNNLVATSVAKQVGITKVIADVLPEDKSKAIKELQEQGKKVIMVGDGVNDAPALALADVGIAVHSGTDVAIDSADMVLMKSDMKLVLTALALSKATLNNIKQNLFWAFCYNALCIPAAAGVLYLFGGPLFNPAFAAFAMTFSSISVVLNALRLKRFKV